MTEDKHLSLPCPGGSLPRSLSLQLLLLLLHPPTSNTYLPLPAYPNPNPKYTLHILILEQLPRGPTSHLGPIYALGEPGNGGPISFGRQFLVAEGPGPVGCQLGPTCMSSQACRSHPFPNDHPPTPSEQMMLLLVLLLKARHLPLLLLPLRRLFLRRSPFSTCSALSSSSSA